MSHYQNFTPPFPIPDSWEWVRLEEIAYVASGSTPAKEYFKESGIPYLKMYNLRNQKIDFLFKPQYITKEIHNGKLAKSKAYSGDLIMNIVGPPLGKLAIIPNEIAECNFNQAAVVIRPYSEKNLINKYLFYYLSQMSEINSITTKGTAGQDNISLTQSQNMRIPVPPLCEMYRLVDKLDQYAELIGNLNDNALSIRSKIGTIKSKILELAMQGRLVPQDPTDEPAADMLRRVNPKARIITDNPHYPQLPDNWVYVNLEDIVDYEQPQPFIVNDTDYSEEYSIPVLTAGKSFILGYTNEDFGIYNKLPVIIFDDFTTDTHFVDFPFKVKSSAMKILTVKEGINVEYVSYFMSITRLVGDTHKRYWISEYSKLPIPLPPIAEQKRIVSKVKDFYHVLDDLIS